MAARASGVIIVISFIFAVISGRIEELSTAAVSGSSKAVTLTLSLLGIMCLWSGIMRVMERLGVLSLLSRLLSPILKRVFPDAYRTKHGISEISAAVIANILGIGNAATPLAISAMEALSDGKTDVATDDMVTFTVLGTAFPSIIPTTIITLRSASGSTKPFLILPAVWLTSLCLSVFAVFISRALRHGYKV